MKKFDALKREAEAFNLTVIPEGKKITRRDYVYALREHYLKEKYPDGGIPRHLLYAMYLESPMLAFTLKNMGEEFQRGVWEDDGWVAERKLDGVRIIMVYDREDDEEVQFYGRDISSGTYLPQRYESIYLWGFGPKELLTLGIKSFVLDCELVATKGKVSSRMKAWGVDGSDCICLDDPGAVGIQRGLEIKLVFHAFHLLELNGVDFKVFKWEKMHQVLQEVIDRLQKAGLLIVGVKVVEGKDKKEYFEEIIKNGGEGVILKKKDSHYVATFSRSHKMWLKAKG